MSVSQASKDLVGFNKNGAIYDIYMIKELESSKFGGK